MAALGAALALLVTLIALTSAAARRDPAALAGTLAGILRAGVGTGLLIALTTLALQISDGISADVIASSHQTFWSQVGSAWGSSGFGGFGSSALAMLMAIVQVIAGVLVWLELAVRNAAIYLAVLFFPVALAASIWPTLAGWTSRLARLLFLFVILKPVVLIVLAFAGNAALAGLSLDGGLGSSAGTIIAAITIFALAAMAPWALMLIVAADAESAAVGAGMRAAAGHAVSDGAGTLGRVGGKIRGGAGRAGGALGGAGGAIRGAGSNRPGGGPSGSGGPGGGGGGGTPVGAVGRRADPFRRSPSCRSPTALARDLGVGDGPGRRARPAVPRRERGREGRWRSRPASPQPAAPEARAAAAARTQRPRRAAARAGRRVRRPGSPRVAIEIAARQAPQGRRPRRPSSAGTQRPTPVRASASRRTATAGSERPRRPRPATGR